MKLKQGMRLGMGLGRTFQITLLCANHVINLVENSMGHLKKFVYEVALVSTLSHNFCQG
jgi:hypothetical protein